MAGCTAALALLAAGPASAQERAATVPSAQQLRSAAAFAQAREGTVAWAVIDTRGRLHGRDATRVFPSASVSKALLLVAALRRLGDRPVPADLDRLLDPMIRLSGNRAARALYPRVGRDAAFRDVARAARLRRLRPAGGWSELGITAADVARFFRVADRIVPRRHRAYVRDLLGGVTRKQRWGVPFVAEPDGWEVLIKGGWRRGIIHQGALAERDGRRVALAVLSDDNPSHDYGTWTVEGVARRLLTSTGDLARTAGAQRAPTAPWTPSPTPRPSRSTTPR